MDRVIDPQQLEGWIPFRLDWKSNQPRVDWCYAGEERFIEPFMDDTITRAMRRPFNLLFHRQTSFAALESLRERQRGLTPTGFIFHLSRSGSTLISQMLASLEHNIVVSEARVIDSAIRSYQFVTATEDQRAEWLRLIVDALGYRRGDAGHYIIKFDAWNIVDFEFIKRAFPHVPWLFVYRDPVEVVVSQFDRRGAHVIPGALDPGLFGMDLNTATSVSPEEFCCRVLATICESALCHHHEGGMLLNYAELPDAVIGSVADFFGIHLSESDAVTLRKAARRDAKNPSKTFQTDSEKKRQKASEAIREAANTWLYPVYEKLEAARLSKAIPAINH